MNQDHQNRISALEAELDELRHIVLCLCLQLQPPEHTGRHITDYGYMVTTQEREISKLTRQLMGETARPARPVPVDVRSIQTGEIIGPNRCGLCGGEYGEHETWCENGPPRLPPK